MSIMVDRDIRSRCRRDLHGHLPMIDPFVDERLQPTSYDVLLGNTFQVIDKTHMHRVDMSDPQTFKDLYHRLEVPDDGFYAVPSKGAVLACTKERVCIPPDVVGVIVGKSGVARLFLQVEQAGFLDPNFQGVVTMELYNQLPVPIILRPGQPIAQLVFHELEQFPDRVYGDDGLKSHYQGDMEATGSRFGT
jgi:dCTP deaminase